MVEKDVVLNKVSTIERCILRVREVYANDSNNLKDFTKQDSIILNIQRASEASIDLAMHIVSDKKLGLPRSSRDAFKILEEENILQKGLADSLVKMVGFRNIAVHDYQRIDLTILQAIIEKHLQEFTDFTKVIIGLN